MRAGLPCGLQALRRWRRRHGRESGLWGWGAGLGLVVTKSGITGRQ